MEKRYLGDSVYAAFNGQHIVLTTENGLSLSDPSNIIYLEYTVCSELIKYITETRNKIAAIELEEELKGGE